MIEHLFESMILIWFAAMAAIVIWRLLVSGLQFSQMLITDSTSMSHQSFQIDRIQQLVVTFGAMLTYIVTAYDSNIGSNSLNVPDVPDALIYMLAGSNGFYLAGKARRFGLL